MWLFAPCVLLVAQLSMPSGSHSLHEFTGKWRNTDRQTRGITLVEVSISGRHILLHTWGACQPEDCDHGTVEATGYGIDVATPLEKWTEALVAIRTKDIVVLRLTKAGSLELESFVRFDDGSARINYRRTQILVKTSR